MTLGTYGSTLLSELNRLANGGTYPPVNTLDQAGAARAWAGLLDIYPESTDTVGVLNEIAGLAREDWLDYSGVCNYLAGTTGLPAAAALRQLTGNPPTPTPGAPTGVTALPANQSANLNFLPPEYIGDSPIIDYRVTIYPGGNTVTVLSSPAVITGLTNGTAYTFTVEARNNAGYGPISVMSTEVYPAFVPYLPTVSNNVTYSGGWIWANNSYQQGGWGFAGMIQFADGTTLNQNETKTYNGSTVITSFIWGCSNWNIGPDGMCTPAWYGGDPASLGAPAQLTIDSNSTCPDGGLVDPSTGYCVESYVPLPSTESIGTYNLNTWYNNAAIKLSDNQIIYKGGTYVNTGQYLIDTYWPYWTPQWRGTLNFVITDFISYSTRTVDACPTGVLDPITNMCVPQ